MAQLLTTPPSPVPRYPKEDANDHHLYVHRRICRPHRKSWLSCPTVRVKRAPENVTGKRRVWLDGSCMFRGRGIRLSLQTWPGTEQTAIAIEHYGALANSRSKEARAPSGKLVQAPGTALLSRSMLVPKLLEELPRFLTSLQSSIYHACGATLTVCLQDSRSPWRLGNQCTFQGPLHGGAGM
jgi:hypothetical protein